MDISHALGIAVLMHLRKVWNHVSLHGQQADMDWKPIDIGRFSE